MGTLERANTPLPETLEKSAGELEAFYNGLGFGVPVKEKIQKLHLMVLEPNKRGGAGFRPGLGILEVPVDASLRSRRTQRHELNHASGHISTPPSKLVVEKDTGNVRQRAVTKVGLETAYVVRKPRDNSEEPVKFFTALNEALNDEIALRAGAPNQSMLSNVFLKYLFYRFPERSLFARVVRNLALAEKRSDFDVFKDFVEAHIVGWTPQLKRELLSAFGPLALKVLAFVDAAGTEGDASLNNWSFGMDVIRFFDLKVPEEKRTEAGKRILDTAKRVLAEKIPPNIRRVPR